MRLPPMFDPELTQGSLALHSIIRHERAVATVSINAQTHLAWLPGNTCVGEEVCILYGAPHPFVVRLSPEYTSKYDLLGDACIDNISEDLAVGPDTERQEWIHLV